MIGALSTFLLLSALSVTQSLESPLKISLTRTQLGDNVTLNCSTSCTNQVNWFKYEFGYVIKTVYTSSYDKVKIHHQFDPLRFIAEADPPSLSIRNVSKEDEGTYLCQAGSYLKLRFVNGNHLVVKDPKKVIHVQHSSGVDSVFPGSTSELQCSVQSQTSKNPDQYLGEQRVYLYEAGSEPYANIIHATSLSCDDHGRRCVYNPSKTIQNFSDSRAFSCAVLSCGQILVGLETKKQIEQQTFQNLIILGIVLACSVLVNTVLFFIRGKACCEHSKDVPAPRHLERGRSEDESNNRDEQEPELSYAALEFPRKSKHVKTPNQFTEDFESNIKYESKGNYSDT